MNAERKSRHRQDILTVSTGSVSFIFPEHLTEADYNDIAEWLVLVQRKLKRFVQSASPTPEAPPTSIDGETL